MYAGYHSQQKKLDHFVRSGGTLAGIDADNSLVAQAALDHLFWTESFALVLESLNEQIAVAEKVQDKTISLSGTASQKSIAELEKRDWTVHQKALYK